MKCRTLFAIVIISLFYTGILLGEEKAPKKAPPPAPKEEPRNDKGIKKPVKEEKGPILGQIPVVLHHFAPVKTRKKYRYYSRVIPSTIEKTLRQKGPFIVELHSAPAVKKAGEDPVKAAAEKAADGGAKYAITGTFNFSKKKLTVDLFLISTRDASVIKISEESGETGVRLKKLTDGLASALKEKIITLERAYIAKEKEKEKSPGTSPYRGLYSAMHVMTFGFETGRVFLIGDWKDLYDNTDVIRPYLNFSLPYGLALHLSAPFYSANNDSTKNAFSNLRVLSGLGGVNYSLYFADFAGISLTVSGGMTRSKITVPVNGDPLAEPVAESASTDPAADASLSLILRLGPLHLSGGASYQRIFFKNTPLSTYTFFGGVGYRI